ncbi:MAG: hypothetical protein JO165_04220, partial [Candidatus Eremiobacteraeota bacterium]|nr:hypothetical protein [Candidatus Eremiobacteraeota bacterium]
MGVRACAILISAGLLLGLTPQPPAELIVPPGQTVVVVEASGTSSEPAASALLMWGFQGASNASSHAEWSSVPYFSGGSNATADEVSLAAERVRKAVGGSARIRADLVRTLGAPEYLGKIMLDLKRPTSSEIERVLEAVADDQSASQSALRAVGVWFRPASACDILMRRASRDAQVRAMNDIVAIGRVFGMQPAKRAISQERTIEGQPSAFLCDNAVPKLPLNVMQSPAQWNSGSFIVKSTRVVAFAMSVLPRARKRKPSNATVVTEEQYGSAPSFVQLHLSTTDAAVSSIGAAGARVNSDATLIAISIYGDKNRALTNALRAHGFDAASVVQTNGQSLLGVLIHGTNHAAIEMATNALRAEASAQKVAFSEAVQAAPFARTCTNARNAALEKASTLAQENDSQLAALAGRHLDHPLAIIEEQAWQ